MPALVPLNESLNCFQTRMRIANYDEHTQLAMIAETQIVIYSLRVVFFHLLRLRRRFRKR
jgi:hypothetical protein